MADITQAAERHVRIPDAWFNKETGDPDRIFYIEPTPSTGGVRNPPSHSVANFTPVGIKVGKHESDSAKQQTSTINRLVRDALNADSRFRLRYVWFRSDH